MKKIFCICIFLLMCYSSIQGQTQETDSIPSVEISSLEVKIYSKPIPTNFGYNTPFSSMYKGELLHCLSNLLGVPITRIKTRPNPPEKYISYNVFSTYKVNELAQRVLDDLMMHLSFDLSDVVDTCDVWILTVKDSSKLDRFSWEKDSPDGTTTAGWKGNRSEFHFFGQTLTMIAANFEKDSEKFIVISDSDDSGDEPQRYKFTVPYPYINIDTLSAYLENKYGVILIKEKKAIKKYM